MSRIAMCLGGLLSAYAAFLIVQANRNVHRKIPVQKAANMLRVAWADHHTIA